MPGSNLLGIRIRVQLSDDGRKHLIVLHKLLALHELGDRHRTAALHVRHAAARQESTQAAFVDDIENGEEIPRLAT